ncbi:hypothetical protein TWF730_004503 [Orbilia blumenaviensis]|uniref:Uncharacterized protein n=1 Tax=Orbilia blumenaviensis TaxID=1796055 RepID=A0AAV9U0R9_9PEZI
MPCHAFYRLWGYTDLRRNLENDRLFKAQSSLLTRGGKANQKPLCQPFPDPSDSNLGVIRVVGVMNHPGLANPIQALGLWEEKNFNCGSFLPRLVIYFQPGQETQIIDLRSFGGEWVYSNWKQIVPDDQYWKEFIAPELTEENKSGNGFVKKITRKNGDHNFAEDVDIVWDTQRPENSWIIDKRPALLARDASKSGFESRFKTELQTLLEQDKTQPLGDDEARALAVELTIMRQALMEQYGKWQMGRIDRHVKGLPQQKGGQFAKDAEADPPIYIMEPYRVWEQDSTAQKDQQVNGRVNNDQENNKDTLGLVEMKEEEDEDAASRIAAPSFMLPDSGPSISVKQEQGDLGTNHGEVLGIPAYMSNIYPANMASTVNMEYLGNNGLGIRNPWDNPVINRNPYTNNYAQELNIQSGLNKPWALSFDDVITLRQQNMLLAHSLLERRALEQAIANNGLLPIRPRPDMNQPIIPKPIRFPAPIPKFVNPTAANTRNGGGKRVLPPAEDIINSIEADQLRKAFVPNEVRQQPTWVQVQGQANEQQDRNPDRLQEAQDFIRDLLTRNKGGNRRSSKDP